MLSPRLIAALSIVGTLIVLVVATQMTGFAGIVAPLALVGAVLLCAKPMLLLLAFWGFTVMVPVLELLVSPSMVKLLEHGLSLYILALVTATGILKRRSLLDAKPFNVLLATLIGAMAISGVANAVPAKSLAYFALTYLKHIWVFSFVLFFAGSRRGRLLFWGLLGTALLQVVFNLAFLAGINPLPHMLGRAGVDQAIGTFGGCSQVSYFMLAAMFLLFAYTRVAKVLRRKIAAYAAWITALLQFAFAYALHSYPLLFLGLAVQHALCLRQHLQRTLRFLGQTLLLAVVLLIFVRKETIFHDHYSVFSTRIWRTSAESALGGAKMDSYREVFLKGHRHLRYPLLGGGPGNYTSYVAQITGRPKAYLPHLLELGVLSHLRRHTGSILQAPRSGFITLWGELGPLGCLAYWGMYIYAAIHVLRQLRRNAYSDFYQRICAEAFIPAMVVFIVLNTLRDALILAHLNSGLWIWAAAVWKPIAADENDDSADDRTTHPAPPTPLELQ
ncbi:MAG: hypothetical protein QGH42_13680 [Kiritimatiellia bacterium]|jgi:hypothetical protein|nr:hypothetical protein [Kiritimatiellia bacterium]MDP6811168.1 hypothetical protein [Kiritimatiellia bacterium]MDP7025275.1 hypothetical protein [Kiritimatiellia bacterium]